MSLPSAQENQPPSQQPVGFKFSEATLKAFGSSTASDLVQRVTETLEIPVGVEQVEVAAADPRRRFSFFQHKQVAPELASILYSLISILVKDPLQFQPLTLPVTEAPSDYILSEDTALAVGGDRHIVQKIRLPLGVCKNEEDVLIERSINSLRISFRLRAPHAAAQPLLIRYLSLIHSSLQRTRAEPKVELVSADQKGREDIVSVDECMTDRSHRARDAPVPLCPEDVDFDRLDWTDADLGAGAGGGFGLADATRTAWSQVLEVEGLTQSNEHFVRSTLYRKRPVPGFALTLLVTSDHVLRTSAKFVESTIWRILFHAEESVTGSMEASHRRCIAVAAFYARQFDADMARACGGYCNGEISRK